MRTMHDVSAGYPLGRVLEFLRALWALEHAIERASKRMEATLGITARQRILIRVVGRYPGIPAGRLARLLHVDPGTLSAIVRRLEARRIVERVPDPRDGRRVTLGLTGRGRGLDRPSEGTLEHAVEAVLDASPPEEIEAATRLLGRLVAGIDGPHG